MRDQSGIPQDESAVGALDECAVALTKLSEVRTHLGLRLAPGGWLAPKRGRERPRERPVAVAWATLSGYSLYKDMVGVEAHFS